MLVIIYIFGSISNYWLSLSATHFGQCVNNLPMCCTSPFGGCDALRISSWQTIQKKKKRIPFTFRTCIESLASSRWDDRSCKYLCSKIIIDTHNQNFFLLVQTSSNLNHDCGSHHDGMLGHWSPPQISLCRFRSEAYGGQSSGTAKEQEMAGAQETGEGSKSKSPIDVIFYANRKLFFMATLWICVGLSYRECWHLLVL